jgi:hypothetical protein
MEEKRNAYMLLMGKPGGKRPLRLGLLSGSFPLAFPPITYTHFSFPPFGLFARWAEHVARMGEKRNAYRLLVGKPEGKRPLRRPRRRWVDILEIG